MALYYDFRHECVVNDCDQTDYTCDSVCKEVGGSIVGYNDLKKITTEEICLEDRSKKKLYTAS